MPNKPMGSSPEPSLLQRAWTLFIWLLICGDLLLVLTLFAVLEYRPWHPEVLRFFGRVWGNFWVLESSSRNGLISGILTGILEIVGALFIFGFANGMAKMKEEKLREGAQTVVILLAIAFFVYGVQFVWEVADTVQIDHNDLMATNTGLHNQIKSLTTPDMTINLDQYGFGDGFTVDGHKAFGDAASVVIVATVRNSGAPSILDHWKLWITPPKMQPVPANMVAFGPKAGSLRASSSQEIGGDKLLYRQTLSAIPQGDARTGILYFTVPKIARKLLEQRGTVLTLQATDIRGRIVKGSSIWTGTNVITDINVIGLVGR